MDKITKKPSNGLKIAVIAIAIFIGLLVGFGAKDKAEKAEEAEEAQADLQATIADINTWVDDVYIPREQQEEGEEISSDLAKIALIREFRLVGDDVEISMPPSIKLSDADKNHMAILGNRLLLQYAKEKDVVLKFGNFDSETYPDKKIDSLYVVSF